MKTFCLGSSILFLLTGLPAAQEGELPIDTNWYGRSHRPHRYSAPKGGGGGGGGGGVGDSSGTTGSFNGPAYTVGSTVSATSPGPGAETHIAVSPTHSQWLVAAISDFQLGYNATKWAVSFDGGSSWSSQFVPISGNLRTTGDGKGWEANSDPVVAVDATDNVYMANLYFNDTDNANGLYISRSAAPLTAGLAFDTAHTYPVVVNSSPTTDVFEDKEWVAVDKVSGRVCVSWTRFIGNTDMIMFSSSANSGQTWSTPIQISPSDQNGGVQGSQVAVGPDGTIYVAWQVAYVGGTRRVYLSRSYDAGVTFTAPVIASTYNELTFNSTYRRNSFPSLAVSPVVNPADGATWVYVAYGSMQGSKLGAQAQIVRSTNGGGIFGSPVTMNDNATGHQFFPSITVDSSGTVHAAWCDTRNGPRSSSQYLDIYASYSIDGVTWAANARVTATTLNTAGTSFIGDYNGIAASGGKAHPTWSPGFVGGNLFTATLSVP
jgi:hypothetical protein